MRYYPIIATRNTNRGAMTAGIRTTGNAGHTHTVRLHRWGHHRHPRRGNPGMGGHHQLAYVETMKAESNAHADVAMHAFS